MKDRIFQVISDSLAVDKSQITESSTHETIENWDSLRHLTLVLALEGEFDIKFDDSEIMDMDNVEKILQAITSRQPV